MPCAQCAATPIICNDKIVKIGMACCECLRSSAFSDEKEFRRYRRNWISIFFSISLTGLAYFIVIPSLHQFVTSSRNPLDSSLQPGLGLSETWYTWVVSIGSVGELFGAVIMGILSRRMYIKHLFLIALFTAFTGGLFFGIGKYGWMLLIGRFCIGFYQGSHQTLWRLYLGETSETVITFLPLDKQKKSTIKYTNFFLAFAIATTNVALGPALSAIAVQIPHLDEFRWPGWFISSYATFLFILTIFLFREKVTDINRKGGKCGIQEISVPYYTIVYIVIAFSLTNWQFAVLDTLQNPILADNFGLDIEYISYIFMCFLIFYFLASLFVYVLQQCHVDIRIICLISFTLSLIGSIVLTDWQSLGGDPCRQLQDPFCSSEINASLDSVIILSWRSQNVCTDRLDVSGEIATPILMSCDPDCINSTTSCDILYTTSTSHDLGTSAVLCMWGQPLLCYWPSEEQFLEISADDVLSNEWESIQTELNSPDGSGIYNDCSLAPVNESHSIIILMIINIHSTISCSDMFLNKFTSSMNWTQDEDNLMCVVGEHSIDLSQCDMINTTDQCVCELFSSINNYQCFWNPSSRINGRYCERCREVCLSKTRSLSFPQLLIGISFLAPGYPMSRISLTTLASDALGRASQGLVMGIMVASGSFGRLSGPIWGNAAYLAGDHRTWIPMCILSGLQVIVIVLFFVLCRTMKPKKIIHVASNGDIDSESRELDTVQLLTFNNMENDEEETEVRSDDEDTDIPEKSDDQKKLFSDED